MVFGMVARDNPDKGWRECIEAFKKIEISYNVAIILVGEGKYLNQLKLKSTYCQEIMTTFQNYLRFSANLPYVTLLLDVGRLSQ